MLKKWLGNRRLKFQAWLDRPLEQKRHERAAARLEPGHLDTSGTISFDRSRLTNGLHGTGEWQPRPDPITTLPREQLPIITTANNRPIMVSPATMRMLKEMDSVFECRLHGIDHWLNVRTERRQARNVEAAQQQGGIMFPEAVARFAEGSPEEAEFLEYQKRMILARARHASDPDSADTTQFAVVTA